MDPLDKLFGFSRGGSIPLLLAASNSYIAKVETSVQEFHMRRLRFAEHLIVLILKSVLPRYFLGGYKRG